MFSKERTAFQRHRCGRKSTSALRDAGIAISPNEDSLCVNFCKCVFTFMSVFLKDFIYLKESEREYNLGKGEADSPLSGEPDGGLDPRTPGS